MLPAEGGLRRIIGDGESRPDGEVEGLGPEQLLALYRDLVLLRTYDERSVIYHRQGRIGTYAIFWNHEAMQAGSVFALEERDWVFPSYRDSAIGLLRGMPVSTVLSWWRGHPAGWWNPEDYNVASICVPIATQIPHAVGFAWGSRLKGEDRVAIVNFGDGATSEGSFHEGATFAGVMKAPGRSLLQQQPVGDLDAAQCANRCPHARRQGDRLRDAGAPGRRRRRPRRVRGDQGGRRPRQGGRGAHVHRSRDLPGRPPRDRRRSVALHRRGARREERENECVGRYERYLRRLGVLTDEQAAAIRAEALELMRVGIAQAEAEPPADVSLVFEHAYANPPPTQATDLDELRRILG